MRAGVPASYRRDREGQGQQWIRCSQGKASLPSKSHVQLKIGRFRKRCDRMATQRRLRDLHLQEPDVIWPCRLFWTALTARADGARLKGHAQLFLLLKHTRNCGNQSSSHRQGNTDERTEEWHRKTSRPETSCTNYSLMFIIICYVLWSKVNNWMQ